MSPHQRCPSSWLSRCAFAAKLGTVGPLKAIIIYDLAFPCVDAVVEKPLSEIAFPVGMTRQNKQNKHTMHNEQATNLLPDGKCLSLYLCSPPPVPAALPQATPSPRICAASAEYTLLYALLALLTLHQSRCHWLVPCTHVRPALKYGIQCLKSEVVWRTPIWFLFVKTKSNNTSIHWQIHSS